MRTEEMAWDYLTRAAMTLEDARTAAANGIYSLAVRRAQETVELFLKATLRFLAIEYPKEHDVSKVLLSVKELRPLPPWLAANLELMARVSRELSWKRGAAFYGDEKSATPAFTPLRQRGRQTSAPGCGGDTQTLHQIDQLSQRWQTRAGDQRTVLPDLISFAAAGGPSEPVKF
jgi:HEPN domain-containing protein